MTPPREPRPGDPVTAEWARAVVRALRSLRLRGGPGVRVSSGPDGTTVSAAPPVRAGADAGAAGGLAVIASVNAAASGPRQATVRDPETWEARSATVCPAEIAGQFTGAAMAAAWVVAIRVPGISVGVGDRGE